MTVSSYRANGKHRNPEKNANKPPKMRTPKAAKPGKPDAATPNPRAATVLDGVVPNGFAGPPDGFF